MYFITHTLVWAVAVVVDKVRLQLLIQLIVVIAEFELTVLLLNGAPEPLDKNVVGGTTSATTTKRS